METMECICKRCSLKSCLSDRPVEPEMIDRVLDAARLAPSARNTQAWRFVVVQGKEAVRTLVQGAYFAPNAILEQAPAIIVACARPGDDVTIDGKEYYLFDLGLAIENMLLAATDLGLVTHLVASFNETEMKRILHIPDDVRVVITTPLAYPPQGSYNEAAAERLSQRSRKGLKEIAYVNRWGSEAGGLSR
jgi:nitroreductase